MAKVIHKHKTVSKQTVGEFLSGIEITLPLITFAICVLLLDYSLHWYVNKVLDRHIPDPPIP